jgi:hypothetical protein
VDSVFIKANASMDSLVEKVLDDASAFFVDELEENSDSKPKYQKETSGTTPPVEKKL